MPEGSKRSNGPEVLHAAAVTEALAISVKYLGLWKQSHTPPDKGSPKVKEIMFDPSYSQLI